MDKSAVKRKKIGLVFLTNYKEWAGGVIYILNIVSALKLLDDDRQPELVIYHYPDSPINDVQVIGYPYIKFIVFQKPSFWQKLLNYTSVLLTGESLYFKDLPEVIYPDLKALSFGKKPIFWIPDFQNYHLPLLWSASDKKAQIKYHRSIAGKKGIVVFSSEDAMNDFKKFYPEYKCELRLLRFACTLPEFQHLKIEHVRAKHGISGVYFMCPNQFWKHKNHKVILEAIALLKDKNLQFQVVFTGSENDHRNRGYFQELKDFIVQNNIQPWVKFLGFIDRAEQLKLMDHAAAIVQTSLFEGWSTVVEDAKAQSQYIILSNLKVHKEQINENCRFFDPHSPVELAAILEETICKVPIRKKIDYKANIKKFASDFIEVVNY